MNTQANINGRSAALAKFLGRSTDCIEWFGNGWLFLEHRGHVNGNRSWLVLTADQLDGAKRTNYPVAGMVDGFFIFAN